MKVVFEGLSLEPAMPKAETGPMRMTVPMRRKSRVQLQPISAPTRLFHAFYA